MKNHETFPISPISNFPIFLPLFFSSGPLSLCHNGLICLSLSFPPFLYFSFLFLSFLLFFPLFFYFNSFSLSFSLFFLFFLSFPCFISFPFFSSLLSYTLSLFLLTIFYAYFDNNSCELVRILKLVLSFLSPPLTLPNSHLFLSPSITSPPLIAPMPSSLPLPLSSLTHPNLSSLPLHRPHYLSSPLFPPSPLLYSLPHHLSWSPPPPPFTTCLLFIAVINGKKGKSLQQTF